VVFRSGERETSLSAKCEQCIVKSRERWFGLAAALSTSFCIALIRESKELPSAGWAFALAWGIAVSNQYHHLKVTRGSLTSCVVVCLLRTYRS
jgi:hypothetical protein